MTTAPGPRSTRLAWLASAALVIAIAAPDLRAQRERGNRPVRDTPAQQTTTPQPSASINGRVLVADSGRPLRRVRVLARSSELPEGRGALTDDSGGFELAGLPAGRYTLTASKTGFVSLAFGQRRPLQPGTPLQLGEGERMGPLEFRLPRGSVIAGRISDEGGEPLPGATIRVFRFDYAQGARQLVPVGTVQSDDKGQYRVWGLNPGDYYVSAQTRGGGPGPGARLGPAAGRGGFVPPQAARGAGRAFDAAAIGPDDPDAFAYAPTYFPGVPAVAEARPITLGVGAETADIDFSLLLARTSRVSGRVSNADGSPATGGTVNMAVEGQTGRGGPGYASRISWDGSFAFAGVPPGRYTVRARTDDTGTPQFAAQPLTVSGDIPDLSVVLAQPGSLGGTVSVQTSRSGVPPDITQFRISAPSLEGTGLGPQPSARPDKDGQFSLDGIPAGPHWVSAQGPRGWALSAVLVDGQDDIDLPVDVASGRGLKGVSLVFTDKLTELNGNVGYQRGTPLTDYTVLAFSTETDYWRPDSRHIATARRGQTRPVGSRSAACLRASTTSRRSTPRALASGSSRCSSTSGARVPRASRSETATSRRRISGWGFGNVPQKLQHAEHGDRHGVRAQRPRSHPDEPDTAALRGVDLRRLPSTLWPYQHGDVARRRLPLQRAERSNLPTCARFDEHERERRRALVQVRRQRERHADLGQHRAAALLHRRQDDPLPALDPCASHERRDRRLGPCRHDRLARRHAEHDRVADDRVHLVALEHGLDQRDVDRRFGDRFDAAEDAQLRVAPDEAADLREPLSATAVEDRHAVAHAEPQHAAQVLRFILGQHDPVVTGIECRREEAMHGRIIGRDTAGGRGALDGAP